MHKNETKKKNGVAGDKVSLEQNYDVEEPKLLQTLLYIHPYRCSWGCLNKSTHLHTAGLSDTSDPKKEEVTKGRESG